jgi:hypothetical protein
MPYRLRRSPLFWIGLLIALFLAFAWRDSATGHQSGVGFLDDGPQMASLRSGGSAVRGWLKWEVRSHHPSPGHRWITFRDSASPYRGATAFPRWVFNNQPYHGKRREVTSTGQPVLSKNGEQVWEDDTIYQTDLTVPYWMMLAVHLPSWLLLLFWRARRQNSLVRKAAHGPVATATS